MHSCETLPAPPASGPNLLLQLGRLIIRARSSSPASRAPSAPRDRLLHAKLLAAKPSTSKQVHIQPKPEKEEVKNESAVEVQLSSHVHALWNEQIPVCIEVLLAPNCSVCYSALTRSEEEAAYDMLHCQQRALLLERWTMRAIINKNHDSPAFITSQWLLNAVRSQLHFSQLSAWLATIKSSKDDNPSERMRKLSRETCNFKKLEANCDDKDLPDDARKLNVVYSIKIPGESYKMAEFSRPPTDHTFPITDIGDNVYLKVVLESLPRIDDIPAVACTCKRRTSKDIPPNTHEELVVKLNDLSIAPKKFTDANAINANIGTSSRRLSIISNPGSTEYLYSSAPEKKLVDDRMHTNCSESGKHKCNCDEESDGKERSSTSLNEPKKLDERRLKEIAKYKRRLRKESKLKKLSDSTSSEGDGIQKTLTSIPILQAARLQFDRFRAIGCYRNQTYLTLPTTRIETKSPFVEAVSFPPTDFKKTNTVATQTDDVTCHCGTPLQMKCEGCIRGIVRSEAVQNFASLFENEVKDEAKGDETGARRKREDEETSSKKHKCDNSSSNITCDIYLNNSFSNSCTEFIKRPKLRRFFPIVDRVDKIVTDRHNQKDQEKDAKELNLQKDDTVFLKPKQMKRQKTFSINEDDYVFYEKCDYGTFDRCEMDSPKEIDQVDQSDFNYGTSDRCEMDSRKQLVKNGYKFPESSKKMDSSIEVDQNGIKFPDSRKKIDSPNELYQNGFKFPDSRKKMDSSKKVDQNGFKFQDHFIPSPTEMDRFRWRFDSAASMVFHTKTGLPLTSSPAPLRRGNNCFDFDDSINGISGIKSALFHPISPPSPSTLPASPTPSPAPPRARTPPPLRKTRHPKLKIGPSTGLLGSFEESALKGRLEPVATVHGFTAELGASGAFCPPHKRLPVTVFFYAPGGTNAPYMGHINLGPGGYRVARSGTIQVSLFNPHGTLVKMFVVLYDLTAMPAMARTFLRQRTLYMPAGADPPAPGNVHKWLRYLIHLRFMTSKSGKLYLHTDIRIIVSRKADLDTATAHSAIFRPVPSNNSADANAETKPANRSARTPANRTPNRVFGGCSEFDSEFRREIGYEQSGVSYELRSFTYAPENPKYSPR